MIIKNNCYLCHAVKSVNRGHIVNIIAGFLLAVISVYYVNSTLFIHTHTIDGATIVHSHFYGAKHTSSEDDGHTKNEITLIQHLNTIITLKGEAITIAECYSSQEYGLYIPTAESAESGDLLDQSAPRAPPYFFV
ncbi:MAG: hypothetical protein SNG10_02360 [Rikenellaceae bacterium]